MNTRFLKIPSVFSICAGLALCSRAQTSPDAESDPLNAIVKIEVGTSVPDFLWP